MKKIRTVPLAILLSLFLSVIFVLTRQSSMTPHKNPSVLPPLPFGGHAVSSLLKASITDYGVRNTIPVEVVQFDDTDHEILDDSRMFLVYSPTEFDGGKGQGNGGSQGSSSSATSVQFGADLIAGLPPVTGDNGTNGSASSTSLPPISSSFGASSQGASTSMNTSQSASASSASSVASSSQGGESVTLEQVMWRAGDCVRGKYYGYRFTSALAEQEIADHEKTSIKEQFHGTFFASPAALADPDMSADLQKFATANSITFVSSETVMFDPNSLYLVIAAEPNGLEISLAGKQCDDGICRGPFNGDSMNESITKDGAYVAFQSDATNIVPNDTNAKTDVFLYEAEKKTMRRISTGSFGKEANEASFNPVLNASGTVVVYTSRASNLIAHDTNGRDDVFVFDRARGTTKRISVGMSGQQANGHSATAPLQSVSADGKRIVFGSDASNIVSGDTNGKTDVFLYDAALNRIERINVGQNGAQAGDAAIIDQAVISANGKYVAFASFAKDPRNPMETEGSTGLGPTIYLYSVYDKTLARIAPFATRDIHGIIHAYNNPSVSDDGRFVSFTEYTFADPASPPLTRHVFVYDANRLAITQEDVSETGVLSDGMSDASYLSGDGSRILFASDATNLIDGQTIPQSQPPFRNHLYLRSRQSGAVTHIDAITNVRAGLSGDGRYIAYDSTKLSDTHAGIFARAYTFDTQTSVRTLVESAACAGVNGSSSSSSASDGGSPIVISNIIAYPGTTTAEIHWDTDRDTDAVVEYGLTDAYGKSAKESTSSLTKKHAVILVNVQQNMLYHFRVVSQDKDGNIVRSDNKTFMTKVQSGPVRCVAASDLGSDYYLIASANPQNRSIHYQGYTDYNTATGGAWEEGGPIGVGGLRTERIESAGSALAARATGIARWCISQLPIGDYEVRATWPASYDAAIDSPFTIYDGTRASDGTGYEELGTSRVNQTLVPAADTMLLGAPWQTIGTFRITGSKDSRRILSVELRNHTMPPSVNTKAYGIADAVWIVPAGSGSNSSSQSPNALRITSLTLKPGPLDPNTSEMITWSTNQNTNTFLEYGLTTAYGTQTGVALPLVGSHSVTLRDLSPATVYHARVRATNDIGETVVSPDQTFQTAGTPAGNLRITSSVVLAKQYMPGVLGDPLLHLRFTAENEDVNISTIRLFPELTSASIETLQFFKGDELTPMGQAAQDRCESAVSQAGMPYCWHSGSEGTLVIPKGQTVDVYVRPKIRPLSLGFIRGERLRMLLSAAPLPYMYSGTKDAIDATGVTSGLRLQINSANGNRKIVIDNQDKYGVIASTLNQSVLAKITQIVPEVAPIPSTLNAKTPIGIRTIGTFDFRSTNVVLDHVIFDVHATNMSFLRNAFAIVDDRIVPGGVGGQDPVRNWPCSAKNLDGTSATTEQITGVFLVQCDVNIPLYKDAGFGVLHLVGSLVAYADNAAQDARVTTAITHANVLLDFGTDKSHIMFHPMDDAYPYTWIDQPGDAIESFVLENPAGLPASDAVCIGVDVPAQVEAGQSFPATVTLRNTGRNMWAKSNANDATGYRLSAQDPPGNTQFGMPRIGVPEDAVPGTRVPFVFTAKAPNVPGVFPFTYRMMMDDNPFGFGQKCETTIVVKAAGTASGSQILSPDPNDRAQCVRRTVPIEVRTGESFGSFVQVQNTGQNTWTQGKYELMSQSPPDTARWTTKRVPMGGDQFNVYTQEVPVKPQGIASFMFWNTAPQTSGIYDFDWGMTNNNVAPFPSLCTQTISVKDAPASLPSGAANGYDAVCIGQPPLIASGGTRYMLTMFMRNTGFMTWDSAVNLNTQNPPMNPYYGFFGLATPLAVMPGEQTSYSTSIIIPSKPGTYYLQWRLRNTKTDQYFGETCTQMIRSI